MSEGSSSDPTGRADRQVDLHSHSTASDGALTPAAVIAAAQAAGLAALALTDHDTVAGVAEAQAAGAALGVEVVPGVELSAIDAGGEVHLLGLHMRQLDRLEEALASFRESRLTRAVEIVRRLNALGVPVTLDAVLAAAGSGAVGRPHVARALVEGGWVRDFRDAFDRYLGTGRPASVEKQRLLPADAIALIHEVGGLAIIAHPGRQGTAERIGALAKAGLDGLEVLHPSHSPDEVSRLTALGAQLDLVPSGGSDWHGAADGPRTLGGLHVPYAWLEMQRQRLRRRLAAERVA